MLADQPFQRLVEVLRVTLDELEVLGAVKAYARVKALRPKFPSLNLLWALAAGLEDRHWNDLSTDEKAALVAELKAMRR